MKREGRIGSRAHSRGVLKTALFLSHYNFQDLKGNSGEKFKLRTEISMNTTLVILKLYFPLLVALMKYIDSLL